MKKVLVKVQKLAKSDKKLSWFLIVRPKISGN